MPQPGHVRSHLVPRCYLRRFADQREHVRVYEKNGNVPPYITSIENTAVERDFYIIETAVGPSHEIETRLSDIENHACEALVRLAGDVWPMEGQDRDWLANFIALQFTRGRHFRDMQNRIANEALKLLARGRAANPEWISAQLGPNATEDEVRQTTSVLRNGRFTVTPDQSASVIGALKTAARLVQPLGMMRWNLMKASTVSIISSDAPVTLWREPSERDDYEGIGILTADEIAVPVDPQHALILLPPDDAGDGSDVVLASNNQVAALNSRTILGAFRQIYAHPATEPSGR